MSSCFRRETDDDKQWGLYETDVDRMENAAICERERAGMRYSTHFFTFFLGIGVRKKTAYWSARTKPRPRALQFFICDGTIREAKKPHRSKVRLNHEERCLYTITTCPLTSCGFLDICLPCHEEFKNYLFPFRGLISVSTKVTAYPESKASRVAMRARQILEAVDGVQ